MPYISRERRKELEQSNLDKLILNITARNLSAGDLNYIITKLLVAQIPKVSYTKINELVGVLECAKLELYSRLACFYEAEKERQNGDVYQSQASNINLAWAGGFFEGEGCFYIHKQPKRLNGTQLKTAAASLVQKGLQGKVLLEQFKNVTKLGYIGNPNSQDIYTWRLDGNENVNQLFNLLRPYLGERRQKRYLDIQKEVSEQEVHKRALKTSCKKGHLYSEVGQLKDNSCKLCNSEYQKAWYHKNKKPYEDKKIKENGDVYD
jgi:hypothetical protein